jgi:DNA-binding NarL/FixJ family response regulator
VSDSVDVLLADECEILRVGLRHTLESRPGLIVVAEAGDGAAAARAIHQLRPNLIVLEADLPSVPGNEVVCLATDVSRNSRIITYTSKSDRLTIVRMLRAGTHGYVLKSGTRNEFLHAVKVVTGGHTYLSPSVAGVVSDLAARPDFAGDLRKPEELLSSRETEVLQALVHGKSNKEIADNLRLTVRTIESHRAQLMKKLNLRSVAALTKYAIREGLTSVE